MPCHECHRRPGDVGELLTATKRFAAEIWAPFFRKVRIRGNERLVMALEFGDYRTLLRWVSSETSGRGVFLLTRPFPKLPPQSEPDSPSAALKDKEVST